MVLLNCARLGTNSPLLSEASIRIPRMRPFLCLFLLLIMPALAAAQAHPFMTSHMRKVTLNGQAPLVGKLPATQSMSLDVVLPLRDPAGLENFLQGLYDPNSPSYRHFLTVQDFTAMFGPSQ